MNFLELEDLIKYSWMKNPLLLKNTWLPLEIYDINPNNIFDIASKFGVTDENISCYSSNHTKRSDGRKEFLDNFFIKENIEEPIKFLKNRTLIVRKAYKYFPKLQEVLTDLTNYFDSVVSINFYLSSEESSGFPIHHDGHHVFAVQLFGNKSWELWKPMVSSPMFRYEWGQQKPKDRPIDIITMKDSTLYIPLGWLHKANTPENLSLHATIGINPLRWIDVIENCLDTIGSKQSLLRSPIPASFLSSNGFSYHFKKSEDLDVILSWLIDEMKKEMNY